MLRRALNPGLAVQALLIKVSANMVVQVVKRLHYHSTTPSTSSPTSSDIPITTLDPGPPPFDIRQIAEFALYGALGSQVGNIIQFLLEDWFPTRTSSGGSRQPHSSSLGGASEILLPLPATMTKSSSRSRSRSPSAQLELSSFSKDKPLLTIAEDTSLTTLSLDNHNGTSPALENHNSGLLSTSSLSNIRWLNVLAKLLLDQTIGLYISASIFLICTNFTRVSSWLALATLVQTHIGAVMRAGWHIWPLVAVCNFLWVPVRSRVLVSVIVGFGWSIFLSIFVNEWK